MAAKKKSAPPKTEAQVNAPEVPIERNTKDIFETLGKWTPWIVLGFIFLICFVVFKDYLLYDKIYYFKDISSDSYNFSYPTLYGIADYMGKYGLPKWSFKMGMGQSIFPFMLRDPFDIFLFLAGKNSISHGLVYLEILKILLSGTCFFYYLKHLKLTNYTAIVGTLLFSFCGFMVEGSGWYLFSFEAFNLALLLLAFERLLAGKGWYLFVLAIFCMGISMPFNLYIYGLFIAIYALLRCYQEDRLNIKATGALFLQMIGLGIIGLLIAGPFLLENIVQLIESPRVSGANSYSSILMGHSFFSLPAEKEFGTCMLRFFSNDMMYSGLEFRGWKNILEAPMFYCGLPCLLLMPQVFPFLNKKVRTFFIIFMGAWLLPIFIPYLRYAFWLFTGDYYRAYSFFVAVVFIFYSLHALDLIIKKGKTNLIVLGVTVVILFVMLNYPYFEGGELTNPTIKGFTEVMILVYAGLIFALGKLKDISYIKYVFLALLVVELCYFSGTTANQRDNISESELTDRVGYNDYTVDAVKYVRQNDKSFFRIDKSYGSSLAIFGSLNDGMVQDYNGTSAYNPFNQLYYISFLQSIGIADKGNENSSRWAMGLISRPLVESQNRVKYMFTKKAGNPIWQMMCDSLTTIGNVKVFKNKYVLPFGHTFTRFIKESVFETLSPDQKGFMTLNACVIKDSNVARVSGLKELTAKDTTTMFNFDIYRQWVGELSKDSLTVTKFSENAITGTATVGEDKIMYLSVPFDDGWKLKVDGTVTNKLIVDEGMTGIMLKKGQHTIEMNYDLRYWNKGLIMSLVGLICMVGLFFVWKRKPVAVAEEAA